MQKVAHARNEISCSKYEKSPKVVLHLVESSKNDRSRLRKYVNKRTGKSKKYIGSINKVDMVCLSPVGYGV